MQAKFNSGLTGGCLSEVWAKQVTSHRPCSPPPRLSMWFFSPPPLLSKWFFSPPLRRSPFLDLPLSLQPPGLLSAPVLLPSPGSSSALPPWPSLPPHQLHIFTSAAVQLDVFVLSRPRLFPPYNPPLSNLMVL